MFLFDLQVVEQEDSDNVLSTVLEENSELQRKNTRLIKRLADQERKLNSYKEEIQQLKQSKKVKTEPVRTEKPEHDRKLHSFQEQQQGNLQVISKQRDELMSENIRLNQELKKMRESLDFVTRQNSDTEKRIKELDAKSEHFEIEYRTEKEDNDKLRAKIGHLQQQFDSLLGINPGVAIESGNSEDQRAINVGQLQERIKQLNEDIAKVNEHSKSQSRQIMRLRQQADMTKVCHDLTHNVHEPTCTYTCTLCTMSCMP